MSKRAEEKALEAYPERDYNTENYVHFCDTKNLDIMYRTAFELGYEQAEKDTAERAWNWFATTLLKRHCLFESDVLVLHEGFRKAMEEEK